MKKRLILALTTTTLIVNNAIAKVQPGASVGPDGTFVKTCASSKDCSLPERAKSFQYPYCNKGICVVYPSANRN